MRRREGGIYTRRACGCTMHFTCSAQGMPGGEGGETWFAAEEGGRNTHDRICGVWEALIGTNSPAQSLESSVSSGG